MIDPNDKIINSILPYDEEDEIEENQFDEDPLNGINEPDDFGLNNSWDWAGGD